MLPPLPDLPGMALKPLPAAAPEPFEAVGAPPLPNPPADGFPPPEEPSSSIVPGEQAASRHKQ
jgi:hypothetical protein